MSKSRTINVKKNIADKIEEIATEISFKNKRLVRMSSLVSEILEDYIKNRDKENNEINKEKNKQINKEYKNTKKSESDKKIKSLTDKEIEAIEKVATMTQKKAAEELNISIKSLEERLNNARKKLNVKKTFQAVEKIKELSKEN